MSGSVRLRRAFPQSARQIIKRAFYLSARFATPNPGIEPNHALKIAPEGAIFNGG